MKTYMFPGQGSQAKGMGEGLFDNFEDIVEKADDILGYSIRELCLDDPDKVLGQTQYTQPALYTVSALSYFDKLNSEGTKPDFVIGHSLGEFNALLASECFDFETGLEIVKKRGELMAQADEGGMAAIINASKEDIEQILKSNNLNNIDIANYNSPSQIVISGLKNEIAKAQTLFQQGKMMYFPLNTSGAFHSRFMQPAKDEFREFLEQFTFEEPAIPVIANVSARTYKKENVASNLANQITGAVKWTGTVQFLLELENKMKQEMAFEELGHGDVLTKLVQKIRRETPKTVKVSNGNREARPISDQAVDQLTNVRDNRAINTVSNGAASEAVAKGIQEPSGSSQTSVGIEAQDKVSTWNENNPIGTKVKSLINGYGELTTRTEAMVLFGHRAAVYMQDYNGYFDLDEIAPV